MACVFCWSVDWLVGWLALVCVCFACEIVGWIVLCVFACHVGLLVGRLVGVLVCCWFCFVRCVCYVVALLGGTYASLHTRTRTAFCSRRNTHSSKAGGLACWPIRLLWDSGASRIGDGTILLAMARWACGEEIKGQTSGADRGVRRKKENRTVGLLVGVFMC